MKQFHKGQTVILESRNYSGKTSEEKTITRVGRKWAYIEVFGREVAFDAETGCENSQYGYPSYIYTPEMKAEKDRRLAASDALHKAGVRFDFGRERKISTDTLEAILAAIPEAERAS